MGGQTEVLSQAYLEVSQTIMDVHPHGCNYACASEIKDLKKAYAFLNEDWRKEKRIAEEKQRQQRIRERRTRSANYNEPRFDGASDAWHDWGDFISLEWNAVTEHMKTLKHKNKPSD